ncbi:MAG TPA: flagellar basal body-associated FliL family protein [Spirochaetia bacterium]|nr:flagellar basal body-associated FliL family protein [Spirochaetia bacterium]
MAKEVDDDALDAAPQEGDAAEGKKKGGPLPEFVILILKIVAGALGAILLSATVSVIVFSLMQGDKPTQQTVEASPVYNLKPPVHEWFSSIPDIRASTADDPGRSVILKVQLAYDSKTDVRIFTELTQRIPQIQDMLRRMISTKTAKEMKEREDEFKEEIKMKINDILQEGRIRDVAFIQFIIAESI